MFFIVSLLIDSGIKYSDSSNVSWNGGSEKFDIVLYISVVLVVIDQAVVSAITRVSQYCASIIEQSASSQC